MREIQNSKFKFKICGCRCFIQPKIISCSLTEKMYQQSFAECSNDYERFRVACEHFVLFEQMNNNEKGTKTTYLPVCDVGID